MSENYTLIRKLGQVDADVLEEKGRTYGASWRSRGGVGAFMMLARKWDRIENIVQGFNYDVFEAAKNNTGDIMDDIADLRRYLLLVEAYVCDMAEDQWARDFKAATLDDGTEPGRTYVNPDL